MNAAANTLGVAYSTRLTKPANSTPATAAGRNASISMTANRRESGSEARPVVTRTILVR